MQSYIALLRGINVSGQKMINMKDFKALLLKGGFERAMTYIQSGNAVFESAETNTETLAKNITDIIRNHYNFEVPVMVLTVDALNHILTHNPFLDDKKDVTKLHVSLMNETPDAKLIASTRDEKFQSDEFHIDEKVIYIYCPDGYGMTKFSNSFFEKKLDITATTRSWKTLEALKNLVELPKQ